MSRFVQISPVPPHTQVQQIKDMLHTLKIVRCAIKESKAYLEFRDASDLEALDFQWEDVRTAEMNNAQIRALDEDFIWPEEVAENPTQNKDSGVFILQDLTIKQPEAQKIEEPQKKQSPQKQQNLKPTFIVVKNCDKQLLESMSKEKIKISVFGKFKIGRIFIWGQEVYVEFMDPNEVETLENTFPSLIVEVLGQKSLIDMVDESFDADIIQDKVRQYQKQIAAKKAEEEKKKQEQILRKSKQMEEIQKNILRKQEEEMKRRKEEMREKEREAENENKNEQQTWTINPNLPRPERNNSTEAMKLSSYWLFVSLIWASYILFF